MKFLTFLISLALFSSTALAANQNQKTEKVKAPHQSEQTADSQSQKKGTTVPQTYKDVTELKIEDLQVGQGKEAVAGKQVSVQYTGWLTNGTKFDSSLDRKQAFTFQLGAGQVIQGWDKGVAGMKEGGKRKLIIPPNMAYGTRGAGGVIPPNATLVFEVTLENVH